MCSDTRHDGGTLTDCYSERWADCMLVEIHEHCLDVSQIYIASCTDLAGTASDYSCDSQTEERSRVV